MDVREKLQDIFRDVFDDDGIVLSDEMTSKDVEDWDSISHLSLIFSIEKEFGIKFTVDEITKTKNVGEFISVIEKKLNARNA